MSHGDWSSKLSPPGPRAVKLQNTSSCPQPPSDIMDYLPQPALPLPSHKIANTRTYGGNAAFHNFNNDYSHISDPNLRRRLALAEIDKVPFGFYHVRAVLVAGIGFFTDSYDIFASKTSDDETQNVWKAGTQNLTGQSKLDNFHPRHGLLARPHRVRWKSWNSSNGRQYRAESFYFWRCGLGTDRFRVASGSDR